VLVILVLEDEAAVHLVALLQHRILEVAHVLGVDLRAEELRVETRHAEVARVQLVPSDHSGHLSSFTLAAPDST
jgi:hypothetical protein